MVTSSEQSTQLLEDSIFDAGFTPKIVNISSYVLNATEVSLLAKGKKFCPTPIYSDFLELKVEFFWWTNTSNKICQVNYSN